MKKKHSYFFIIYLPKALYSIVSIIINLPTFRIDEHMQKTTGTSYTDQMHHFGVFLLSDIF